MAFGLGAALYIELPREPQAWVAMAAVAVAVLLLVAARRWAGGGRVAVALTLIAFAGGGFGLAKLRAENVRSPVAPAGGRPQVIEGWVDDVAQLGQGGPRLAIAPVRIGDWPVEAIPVRVRVTLKHGAPIPAPGQAVRLLAMINAPPAPVAPGAYDFARDSYFQSIGGVGFALKAAEPADLPPAPWRLRLAMRINAARWALTQRMVATMGPESGGLAAAMTTGYDAFIPADQVSDLRASGLAHIISISGVHMAIVGGFAFALARLLIAAWPWAALRIPGKKVAALVGLAAVSGYLLLSGAPAPAVRAAITATIAFLAILFDRQAITLRALALAALVVLVLQPEAVAQPGFQMSFAATAALIALAEVWPRPVREINTPWPIRLAQRLGVWFTAAVAASFVAGLATGPFAIQHFNRVSTLGLPANLLAEPISSLIMMPALAVGAALTPFGWGGPPLALAGWGVELILNIAHWAASAPFATVIVASAPNWTLPVAFLGILWLCIWRGTLRWLGLPLALAISLAPRPPPPTAWVGPDGAAFAVRDGAKAILFRPDVKLFAAELWARRRGLTPVEDPGVRDGLYACTHFACAPRAQAPVRIAAVWSRRTIPPARLAALCRSSEVVVLRGEADAADCPGALTLTGAEFARGGAAELYRQADGGWKVVWAQDLRGRRPWTWGVDTRR